jgi:hypothetical protein
MRCTPNPEFFASTNVNEDCPFEKDTVEAAATAVLPSDILTIQDACDAPHMLVAVCWYPQLTPLPSVRLSALSYVHTLLC